MQERYNAEGNAKQTDEFMKPVILEREGLVRGKSMNLRLLSYLL